MDQLDKLSFIVLCPDSNVAGLKHTTNSLKVEMPGCPIIAMVGKDAKDVPELSKYSKIHTAGKTITSLIDEGISISKTDWNFILIASGWVKQSMIRKYQYFRKSNKDILYPVINRKIPFDEASINGIMVHRRAFDEVGKMGDDGENINIVKLMWAAAAIELGYKFKALVGAKIF